MPRGKKKEVTEETTLNVPKNASSLSGTNSSVMKVYTSKPKTTKSDALPKKSSEIKDAAVLEKVMYDISDANHPIDDIRSFVHITIYWIPNSKKFMIENPLRLEGKSLISAPCSMITSDDVNLEEINAVFGMHFAEDTKGSLDFIRAAMTHDTENIRVFHLCEIGLIRDENKLQYTYITH